MENYGSEVPPEPPVVILTIRDGAPVPPLVHLEDIRVFEQPCPRTRLNELRPEENELSFNFVGLSFRDESRVRYRYQSGRL